MIKTKHFYWYHKNGGGWIRVFGRLIVHYRDMTRHRAYFSERNGLGPKSYNIGVYRFVFGETKKHEV